MVKKKELKQRAIYVYPSAKMSERWKSLAGKAHTSISKFVIEHVENSLRQEDENYTSRVDLVEENRGLLEAIREKDQRIDHLDMLVEKLQQDLKTQRDRMFSEHEFIGRRKYGKQLVQLLMEAGPHSTDEIVSRLGINTRDVESIKAVSVQLDRLQRYGLIEPSPKGYIWKL